MPTPTPDNGVTYVTGDDSASRPDVTVTAPPLGWARTGAARRRRVRRRRRRAAARGIAVIGTWNTHRGRPLRRGGLTWLRLRFPLVAVWLLQEVPSRRMLRAVLPRDTWAVVPGPAAHKRVPGSTFVAVHKPTWRVLWSTLEVEDITGGERHTRRRVQVCLVHRATGRRVWVGSVHCQPLGRGLARASVRARTRQTGQLLAYAMRSQSRPKGHAVVDGGDFNQPLRARGAMFADGSAHRLWGRVGMRAAYRLAPRGRKGRVRLDEVMVRGVRVLRRRWVDVPYRGNDHGAVIVRLDLDPDGT